MYSAELPKPILFHPLKHHLGFIASYILEKLNTPVPEIRKDLLTLGTSQLDLYCGLLSAEEVANQVLNRLTELGFTTPEAFAAFLRRAGKDYSCLTLTDGTDWVLRWGVVENRFVHLHPARYAPHTIRVKATALRTAIVVAMYLLQNQLAEADRVLVNKVRREWLGMAPVKTFKTGVGAAKLLDMLMTFIRERQHYQLK